MAARRLLRIRRDRIRVVALAPRPAFRPGAAATAARWRAGPAIRAPNATGSACPSATSSIRAGTTHARTSGRCFGRWRELAAAGRPDGLPADAPWPPRVLFAGASPDDRAALARAAAREGVGEALAYAPRLDDERLAGLVRGARAALLPVVSDSAGLAAIEAIACGTPVVASAVGALPEIVGAAGILVEPRDPAGSHRPSRRRSSTTASTARSRRSPASAPRRTSSGPGPTWPARPARSTPRPRGRATARPARAGRG